jgi:hypothetical protein
MWKICRLQLNHSEEICQNLTAGNETITISSFSLPTLFSGIVDCVEYRYVRGGPWFSGGPRGLTIRELLHFCKIGLKVFISKERFTDLGKLNFLMVVHF